MLGAIIGDTVGSAYEFVNTKDYNFELFRPESNYTDDTVMTVAIARWLLDDPDHGYQTLENTLCKFANACACPMGGYGAGFYVWLFQPRKLLPYDPANGPLPYQSTSGRHPYGSWGNGAAMRVSAVGWFFDTLEETERVAAISAAVSHNHSEGIKGAQATAAAIFLARTGKTKEEICALAENLARQVHEEWALGRVQEGWTYGPVRDDAMRQTPCLVPYEDLPEEEKEYDRRTAFATLKYIVSRGFKITKPR